MINTRENATVWHGRSGFSLIEVVLAMGIAAIALVSILGMLPYAMESSQASADQTAIGTVLEEVHDRIKGEPLEVGVPSGSPYFYDAQGRFWEEGVADREAGSVGNDRFFRVDVDLQDLPSSVPFEHSEGVLAAVVAISWPVDEAGEPRGRGNPKTSITYPLTTLTGPDWQVIDPDYKPKVEY
ncbi:MAG: prepilin-type N-terminal cleavage/methylation domain-containing protein [Verrucomicrobiales bacterium]|jgi:uncharacterized protein (TIGR02598 family)|nr:prepilin-type N-terminal cleavage/methylation domain-containing protein [Verrucomicrobiales bacterium]